MPAPAWAALQDGIRVIEPSFFQQFKLALLSFTGLSRDALHIYLGLLLYFSIVRCHAAPRRIYYALGLLLLISLGAELLDLRDDFNSLGYFRWTASAHDVINTLFWPVCISMMMRRSLNN